MPMLILQEGKQVTDLIYESKKIAIMPTKQSGIDGFCAGVGLYKSMKNAGKEISFVYPHEIPEGCENELPKEEILSLKNTRSLVVNIDYSNTTAEKINYAIEGNICKISITPVTKDFDLSKIRFETSGLNFDLIISIGAQKLTDHEELMAEYGDEIVNHFTINIDTSTINDNFATMNVVENDAESLSQLVLHKLILWRYKVDKSTASTLLKGISFVKP